MKQQAISGLSNEYPLEKFKLMKNGLFIRHMKNCSLWLFHKLGKSWKKIDLSV